MAVRHAGDEEPEPDRARHAGEGGQRRHALEAVARSLAVHRLEVIEPPRAVESELLAQVCTTDELDPLHPLLADVDPEAHLPSTYLAAPGLSAERAATS